MLHVAVRRVNTLLNTLPVTFSFINPIMSSAFSTSATSASSHGASSSSYDYDLVVLGGGSGGLACAKEAAKYLPPNRVLVADYVSPTPYGTKWGLGGTCVNVGCIPKKLMHHAANIGHLTHSQAEQYGWEANTESKQIALTHNWATMQSFIANYIKSLNFSYRVQLRSANVSYENAEASFVNNHTLQLRAPTGKSKTVTFQRAIIATGGRPSYPSIRGKELGITSDDLFWLKKSPGRTVVIGAGYIALECASFLKHLGHDVTVMIRGKILRKMDQQAGEMIGELMERDGIKFISPAQPQAISAKNRVTAPPADSTQVEPDVYKYTENGVEKYVDVKTGVITVHSINKAGVKEIKYELPAGPLQLHYTINNDQANVLTEEFDTVLFATGRHGNIGPLNLQSTRVQVLDGKVVVNEHEQTNDDNIFALGDVAVGVDSVNLNKLTQALVTGNAQDIATVTKSLKERAIDRPELTPVAISAGQHLARKLFTQTANTQPFNYSLVPTAVFTSPCEYSFVGLSEEEAIHQYSAAATRIYWSRFGPIEMSPLHAHVPELKSNVFTGKALWARKYLAETRKHDAALRSKNWGEVDFDIESNQYVTVVTDGQPKDGKVISKRWDDSVQDFVFDVELDQAVSVSTAPIVVPNVPSSALTLSSAIATENAELFIKANNLCKVVVHLKDGQEHVVGMHFIGPGAGEIIQGFSLALKKGLTKEELDSLIGIHPTAAEEFTVLTTTKDSGSTPLKPAGCGGGSCG